MELYATGDVDPAEAEGIRTHIDRCNECRKVYESTQLLLNDIRRIGASMPQEVENRMHIGIKRIASEAKYDNMSWTRWLPLTFAVPIGVYSLAKIGLPLDKSLILTGIGLNLLSLLVLPFITRRLVRE